MRFTLFSAVVSAFLLLAPALCAQIEGPIVTEPHLAVAFPFEQKPEGIGIKYAVLINTVAIVPPNAILRVIYVPPRGDDAEVKVELHKSNSENSWTKKNQIDSSQPKLSPMQLATKKVAEQTVWPAKSMFQLAFANLNSQDLHIVYMNPTNLQLTDEPINFPEGLFLGDVDGTVTVLAVEKGSPGDESGLKAGDQILKVGGAPMNGNLLTFLDAYRLSKSAAKNANAGSFDLAVRSPKDTSEHITKIKLPISLSTSLLDSPLSDPATLNKPAIPKIKPYGSK